MAFLTLVLDNREVRKFVLNKGVTTIGRAQENDIVINNLALSRNHAQVESKSGTFRVVDLKSQNGVYVNGERVQDKHVLRDKDSITLGTYQFVFRDESAEKRPAGKAAASSSERTTVAEESEEELEPVPLLVLKYNDVELQRFPLRGETCMIGRAKECDVQVAERRLSRRHCQIFRGEEGRFFLKDLGSQNGSYVNRRRIRGFYELKHRDVINFAEYSILYLRDIADYRGPDAEDYEPREQQHEPLETIAPPPAMPDSVESAETAMPPAYSDDGYGYQGSRRRPGFLPGGDSLVRPSDLDEDPEASNLKPRPPLVSRPRRPGRPVEPLTRSPSEVRALRGTPAAQIRVEPLAAKTEETPRGNGKAKKKSKKKAKKGRTPAARRTPAEEAVHGDIPDQEIRSTQDPALDGWYASRQGQSGFFDPIDGEGGEDPAAEDSMLLARGASNISRVLSTMMVDKRELAKNLENERKPRQRRFIIDVRHEDERLYRGPLTEAVTILGKDREADIQLRGRYVAGRHSLLVRVRDSLLLVRLGSSSAARVNGLPKLQAFLKSGDVIQIDETTIHISEE